MRCRLCGGDSFAELTSYRGTTMRYMNQSFVYGRCQDCRSIINLEIETPDYADYQTVEKVSTPKVARLVGFLKELGVREDAPILDYGCGNGALVTALRRSGYPRTQGYEPHGQQFRDTLESGSRYSAVYLTHVFEHIVDYSKFFMDLSKATDVGSHVVTIHPSSTRFPGLRSEDPFQCYTIHAPFHAVIPSDRAVQDLFEQNGYLLETLIPYDVQRSGMKDNSRVAALLFRDGGCIKENLVRISKKEKAMAALQSPLDYLNALFLDTRDPLVSTFVFRRS